jgi:ATP-dependent DNA helicase RecG
MLRSELLELIANGENSGVEFKRDDLRPEQLAKEIIAMANFRGGVVLLGVEDDGAVSGIQRNDLETWVMDTVFGRYIHPMLIPFYETITLDDGARVAVISVSMGTAKPYVMRHNGREDIYVRVGSTSRLATREQQARLFETGGLLHSELMPVSGAGFDALDRERLQDYLLTLAGDRDLPPTDEAWRRRMTGLGFMTESPGGTTVCTVAGLVLFARTPRRFLRQAGIRWMAFDGADKGYKSLDDTVIDGPLVGRFGPGGAESRELIENGLIETVLDRVQPFVSAEADELVGGVRRERVWKYPVPALREAIVNALAHRDWTRVLEVEVVSYSDRLEVTSPGALQNSMTIEKMLAGQRSPRNPIIIDVLRDYGYVDARGMGVRNKIVPLIRESSGAYPRFDSTDDYVRLIMPCRVANAPRS